MRDTFLNNKFPIAGGVGEKSLRSIIEMAEKVAEGSLPMDAEHLRRITYLGILV